MHLGTTNLRPLSACCPPGERSRGGWNRCHFSEAEMLDANLRLEPWWWFQPWWSRNLDNLNCLPRHFNCLLASNQRVQFLNNLDHGHALVMMIWRTALADRHWPWVAILHHQSTDFRCEIFQISTKAHLQQFLVELAGWLETSLRHLAQPTAN